MIAGERDDVTSLPPASGRVVGCRCGAHPTEARTFAAERLTSNLQPSRTTSTPTSRHMALVSPVAGAYSIAVALNPRPTATPSAIAATRSSRTMAAATPRHRRGRVACVFRVGLPVTAFVGRPGHCRAAVPLDRLATRRTRLGLTHSYLRPTPRHGVWSTRVAWQAPASQAGDRRHCGDSPANGFNTCTLPYHCPAFRSSE